VTRKSLSRLRRDRTSGADKSPKGHAPVGGLTKWFKQDGLGSGVQLSGADLRFDKLVGADLKNANLRNANLAGVDLSAAQLEAADLRGANLRGAKLENADLSLAILANADLRNANLREARLIATVAQEADLREADLTAAWIAESNFIRANLMGAKLSNAALHSSDFFETLLDGADLRGADFFESHLVSTSLQNADLTGAKIFGISAWKLKLDGAVQKDLVISSPFDPTTTTADDIEMGQFLYLMLDNQKIRRIIDTITTKVVLILGRFTPERKAVLDGIREELRAANYLPVLFDFNGPENRDLTETVSTLAHMARFIIADLTDAKSLPQELMRIVPDLPSVPVQPILLSTEGEWAMFETFTRYPWVLPIVTYDGQDGVIGTLKKKIIDPAERKALEQIRR
jgi:uncharacterized protein YjbI with pentapeptide repeats